jgi:hypothetical protein
MDAIFLILHVRNVEKGVDSVIPFRESEKFGMRKPQTRSVSAFCHAALLLENLLLRGDLPRFRVGWCGEAWILATPQKPTPIEPLSPPMGALAVLMGRADRKLGGCSQFRALRRLFAGGITELRVRADITRQYQVALPTSRDCSDGSRTLAGSIVPFRRGLAVTAQSRAPFTRLVFSRETEKV